LKQSGLWPERAITLLLTSDEEVGSITSRELIEAEARRAEVVFCLEPALANGALKTARKGTGDIEIKVKGVAAHAGVDHAAGRNAIEELAYQIIEVQKLTDYSKGTTLNVGVVRGGTRTNVVPDSAEAWIDLRVTQAEEMQRLAHWVQAVKPRIDGTSISATISFDRPPMPRDARMIQTFKKAQDIAIQLGLELSEGSTGGGSDANFVAPLGIPLLDGLGAVGEGAHSEREFVLIDSLPERTALLATLLIQW
jgi:glutamate carboxypeptidase